MNHQSACTDLETQSENECKGQSFTTSEDVEDLPKASGHSGDWRSAKCWEEAKPSRREAVTQDLDTRGLSMFEAVAFSFLFLLSRG